jgi:hypothetical protein
MTHIALSTLFFTFVIPAVEQTFPMQLRYNLDVNLKLNARHKVFLKQLISLAGLSFLHTTIRRLHIVTKSTH